MAKTYTIKTQIDGKGAEVGLKQMNSLIKSTAAEGNALNKALKLNGNMSGATSGANKLKSALSMAEDRSKGLQRALSEAKMSGASANTIADLTAKLSRSNSEAQHLKTSLAGIDDAGEKGGSGMLQKFSMLGNSMNLLNPAINLVKSGLGAVKNMAVGFAGGFTEQFDSMATSSLTLKNTLQDGEQGLKEYNAEMKKAPLLVQAQKKELDGFAATISSYSQVTGKEAYAIANAVNAVGDSVGAGMDAQQGFTTALGQAMTAGKLMAQDFNQMSQTALGTQFKGALIEAANEMSGVGMSAEDLGESLKKGEVKAGAFKEVFGSDWSKKMAAVMQSQTGLKTSVGMVNDALKAGKLTTEQFSSALGDDYMQKLLAAQNATGGTVVTQENFRQAMEDGAFTTDVLNGAIDKFIKKGEELPQVFNTFGQVREAVKNGFFTGAVEQFMEAMGYANGDLNEFGNAATQFAQGAGKQLGDVIATGAKEVGKFVEANGGVEGVLSMFKSKADEVTGGLKTMASNILTVVGNIMLMTGSSQTELEAMGFDVNKLSGFVTGWSGNTQKMKGSQDKLNEAAKNSKTDFGLLGKIYDNAKNGMFKMSDASKESERRLQSQSKQADNAKNGLNKLDGSAKNASRSINGIPNATVDVSTSAARSQLSYLDNAIDRTSSKLSNLAGKQRGGGFGNIGLGGRDDGLKLDPLLATQNGIMRTSQAYGSLEYYNATTVAGRMGSLTKTSNTTHMGEGAVQIIVQGGNTDRVIQELQAKLRRLGIKV